MVLQHRNITHTSMITVKGKKSSQMMFKNLTNTYIVYRKTDGLEVSGFIIIKSMLSNVSL